MNAAKEAVMDCLELGAKDFVLCSGARNLELISLIQSVQGVNTYHFPEERSAAFFAMGRSIKECSPTVIVTTSGTAVPELFPAVIESFYQSIPLILLTADRPKRYQGTGSPQTIDQINIFGSYAQSEIKAWSANMPLHINVNLEEPSKISEINELIQIPEIKIPSITTNCHDQIKADTLELQRFLNRAEDLFVLVGNINEDLQDDVYKFIISNNLSVYAESTSGLREKLTSALPSDINAKFILRIGALPSCGYWRELENDEHIEVFSVTMNGLPGLSRNSTVAKKVNWDGLSYRFTKEVKQKHNSITLLDELISKYPNAELSWLRHLSECIPGNSLVFLGNSLPSREWEIAATRVSKNLSCYSNRGANGIDGNISTFLGIANNEKESWGIFGDLTAMYDLFAPWIIRNQNENNIRIVVINNGGGKIFSRIDAVNESADDIKESIINNHCIGFESWASMWGINYINAQTHSDLNDIPDGPVIIEVVPDIESSEHFWREL
ncbi:MAG TPA: hypothetical protein EYG40_04935 [Verrucomicrobia bacterium]|nr:hypothetical protein [Verrucomicrobiales bacterium]HIL54363.1 hypothetical protein [Verrucomicrobiota bacterium]